LGARTGPRITTENSVSPPVSPLQLRHHSNRAFQLSKIRTPASQDQNIAWPKLLAKPKVHDVLYHQRRREAGECTACEHDNDRKKHNSIHSMKGAVQLHAQHGTARWCSRISFASETGVRHILEGGSTLWYCRAWRTMQQCAIVHLASALRKRGPAFVYRWKRGNHQDRDMADRRREI
jgi:hypothetical protein